MGGYSLCIPALSTISFPFASVPHRHIGSSCFRLSLGKGSLGGAINPFKILNAKKKIVKITEKAHEIIKQVLRQTNQNRLLKIRLKILFPSITLLLLSHEDKR